MGMASSWFTTKPMKRVLFCLLMAFLVRPVSAQERQVREATAAEVTAGTLGLPAVITPRRMAGGGGTWGGSAASATTTNVSPFRVISTFAPPTGDTNWFGPWTSGTATAGIQEAINSLTVGLPNPANSTGIGGTIQFMPGTYNLTSGVIISNNYYQQIVFQGAGMVSTVLHAPSNVFYTITTNTFYNHGQYYFRDMSLIGDVNALGAVMDFKRYQIFDMDRCYVSWNGYITNAGWGINMAALTNTMTVPPALVGVSLDQTDENHTRIVNSYFQGLAVGIHAQCSHLTALDNHFVHIGEYIYGTTNAWPITNIRATGVGIISSGGYESHIERNQFVQTKGSIFWNLNTSGGNFWMVGNYLEGGGYLLSDGTELVQQSDNIGYTTMYVPSPLNYASVPTVVAGNHLYVGGVSANFEDGAGDGPGWVASIGGTNYIQLNSLSHNLILDSAVSIKNGKVLSGNLTGGTNDVRTIGITISTNYTMTGADIGGMASTNLTYFINMPGTTNVFTFPTIPSSGNVSFTLINAGTNSIILTNTGTSTFKVASGYAPQYSNSVTIGGYYDKGQTWMNLNTTNWILVQHSRTLQDLQDIIGSFTGITNSTIPAAYLSGPVADGSLGSAARTNRINTFTTAQTVSGSTATELFTVVNSGNNSSSQIVAQNTSASSSARAAVTLRGGAGHDFEFFVNGGGTSSRNGASGGGMFGYDNFPWSIYINSIEQLRASSSGIIVSGTATATNGLFNYGTNNFIQTNCAPYTTPVATIVAGTKFTNTFSCRSAVDVYMVYTDAVTGSASFNYQRGFISPNSTNVNISFNPLAGITLAAFSKTNDTPFAVQCLGTNEWFAFYDVSGTGASISVLTNQVHLQ